MLLKDKLTVHLIAFYGSRSISFNKLMQLLHGNMKLAYYKNSVIIMLSNITFFSSTLKQNLTFLFRLRRDNCVKKIWIFFFSKKAHCIELNLCCIYSIPVSFKSSVFYEPLICLWYYFLDHKTIITNEMNTFVMKYHPLFMRPA